MASPSTMATVTSAGAILGISSAYFWWYHRRAIQKLSTEWEHKRMAERKGRIRAEVTLRTHLKRQTTTNEKESSPIINRSMALKCIGTVLSPYTKRMGTPRQGSLVPSSRGVVDLIKGTVYIDTLSGIEDYSHAWIIFGFHANTDLASSRKSKVKPPRGGGIKVGQLATRSPHRPNPIGLSLVKIDKLDKALGRLHISALDLVNGTPVYDIKPCVPWDIPGRYDGVSLSVPGWVDQDDELSNVEFTEAARNSLKKLITEERLAPLYTNDNQGFDAAISTLQEVLSQDPRASNKRGSVTAKEDPSYHIVFGATMVDFAVTVKGVRVVGIQPIDFEETSYVDGIPLVSET